MPDQIIESTEKSVSFHIKTFMAILVAVASVSGSVTTAYWVSVENDIKFETFKEEVDHWMGDVSQTIENIEDDDIQSFQEVKDARAKMEADLKSYIQEKHNEINGRLDRKTDRNAEDIELLRSKH